MLLWDCKREALRGLGVNTGEGNTTRHRYESWRANSCHNKELAVSIVSRSFNRDGVGYTRVTPYRIVIHRYM